ncbi:MAG TPA: universal stress protein [Jatrophihabitans sp.]|jgi:nucleotide-binding universal stress UspA family protein
MFELGTDGPSLILAAVDGSDTSLRAGAYAAGLARRQGSRVICLFVAQMPVLSGTAALAAGAALENVEAIAADLKKQIETNAARLGIPVEFVVRRGEPFAQIAKLADERRADAVVVGASGHAGRRLVGSIASRLVRTARWPVIVVP